MNRKTNIGSFQIALLGLTALALSACAPGRTDYVGVFSTYNPNTYASAPYTDSLDAEVTGDPFGVGPAEMDRIVDSAIRSGPLNESGRVPVRIAFGPNAASRDTACSGGGGGSSGMQGGTVSMVAAFCSGDGPAMSYLVAHMDDVQGPNDPDFKRFLRQTVAQLFPAETDEKRRERQGGDNCVLPNC